MTVTQAIATVNLLYPNHYGDEEKTVWLQKMDERIQKELFSHYLDGANAPLPDYTESEEEITLLVESPYDVLYLYELQAKMAYWDGDTNAASRAEILYRNLYETYTRAYRRSHQPKGEGRFLF